MPTQIDKKWIAVNPVTDAIAAGGDTPEEVRSRLLHLELDPNDYDIVATPKNWYGGSFL